MIVGLLLGAVLLGVALTQGPVPRWLAGRFVARSLGCGFDARWVALRPDGRFVLTEARLLAPGMSGPAAELLTSESLELELGSPGLALWKTSVTAVRVIRPRLRLSQGAEGDDAGTLNWARLKPEAGGGRALALPRVDLVDGVVEFGEHDGAAGGWAYRQLLEVPVRGWLAPRQAGGEVYALSVIQVGGPLLSPNPGEQVTLTGKWDLRSGLVEASVSALDLSAWSSDRVPTAARELWERMRMRGLIERTELRAGAGQPLEVTLRVSDVSLRAPLLAGRPELTGGRMPLMESVSGVLRFVQAPEGSAAGSGLEANLSGALEDLQANVNVTIAGLTPDAPYVAEIRAPAFRLEREPRLLWLVPDVVRSSLEEFGGPTALVDAQIRIERGTPTPERPSGVNISGSLRIAEGRVAYEDFPYPVLDLAGAVAFEGDAVTIRGLRGRGPSGASVLVEGSLNERSALEARVTLTNMPYDEHLRAAVEASPASGVLDAIFSRGRLEQLRQLGVLRSKQAEVLAGPQPMDFDVGGAISKVEVRLERGGGLDDRISRTIELTLDRAGLLADAFAYPLNAERLKVRLERDEVTLSGERFTSLSGAEVGLSAVLRPAASEDGEPGKLGGGPGVSWTLVPTVKVTSERVPVDPLLLGAVALLGKGAGERVTPAELADGVGGVLGRLGISGGPAVDATVYGRGDGTVGFEARLDLAGMSMEPGAGLGVVQRETGTDGVLVTDLEGSVYITDRGVLLDGVSGDLFRTRGGQVWDAVGPPRREGSFLVEGETVFAGAAGADGERAGLVAAEATLSGLELSLPLAPLVGAIMPGTDELLERFLRQWRPAGVLDVDVALTREPQPTIGPPVPTPATVLTATLRNLSDTSVMLWGDRLAVEQAQGAVVVQATLDSQRERPTRVRAGAVKAEIRYAEMPLGGVTAEGELEFSEQGLQRVIEPMDMRLRGGALESPLVRRATRALGGDEVGQWMERTVLLGTLDADVRLEPPPEGVPGTVFPRLAVRPRQLAIEREGLSVFVPRVDGEIRVDPTGGNVEGLTLDVGLWEVRADGAWAALPEGGYDGRLLVSADAPGLTPSLLALLPEGAARSVREAGVKVEQGLSLRDGLVELTLPPAGVQGGPDVRFEAAIDFAGLFADVGLPIADCRGEVMVRVERSRGQERAAVEVGLDAPGLRVAGLELTGASAAVRVEPDGRVVLDRLSGVCYGGRLSGRATVEDGQYGAQVEVAGVRLADALAALAANGRGEPGPLASGSDGDVSRGRVDAEVSLAGRAGDAASRVGRGSVRVAGGDVLRVPLVVPLVQLSNLQLPSGESLDYLHASFLVAGETLWFEDLGLLSPTLAVLGEGTINTSDLSVDLAVRSRARNMELPLISGLLRGLRDELLTARVTGTLNQPQFGASMFLGTRRALGGMAGGGRTGRPDAQTVEASLRRIEAERDRSPGRAPTVPADRGPVTPPADAADVEAGQGRPERSTGAAGPERVGTSAGRTEEISREG